MLIAMHFNFESIFLIEINLLQNLECELEQHSLPKNLVSYWEIL